MQPPTLYRLLWQRKMLLLAGLYISQTLGVGFVTTAVPVILRQSGAGLDTISWIFVLGMCWSIKFLWAPFIDRYGSVKHGHYRSWIIALQSLMILGCLGTACFSVHNQPGILSVFLVLLTFFSATQDIATDGLAVIILKPEERGIGNSIQSAGNMIGFMISGGLILMAWKWLGWKGSLLVLAAGMTLPLILILGCQEPATSRDKSLTKTDYRVLLRFFTRPGIWRWMPILLVFRISNQITYWLLNPFLVDMGWSIDRIGTALNMVGVLFGVAGAGLAGILVSRWKRKQTMLAAMLLGLLGTIGFMGLPLGMVSTRPVWVYLVLGLIMVSFGFGSTVIYTAIMDRCDSSSPATDFTLQWSLTGISAMTAGGIAMRLTQVAGYTKVLCGAACVAVLAIVLISYYQGVGQNNKSTTN